MANTWVDDPQSEAVGLGDLGGEAEASVGYFGVPEESESLFDPLRRGQLLDPRVRREQLAAQAQRAVMTQPSRVAFGRPSRETTVRRAVIDLDTRSKVQANAASRAFNAQSQRITSTQTVLIAEKVRQQVEASFPGTHSDDFVALMLRALPLLILKPATRKSGIAVVAEPQILGFFAMTGIAVASIVMKRGRG